VYFLQGVFVSRSLFVRRLSKPLTRQWLFCAWRKQPERERQKDRQTDRQTDWFSTSRRILRVAMSWLTRYWEVLRQILLRDDDDDDDEVNLTTAAASQQGKVPWQHETGYAPRQQASVRLKALRRNLLQQPPPPIQNPRYDKRPQKPSTFTDKLSICLHMFSLFEP